MLTNSALNAPAHAHLDLDSPAHFLAAEESLLERFEAEGGDGMLLTWESSVPFVVLGHGNAIRSEADVEACEKLGVPILRRISGGGAVVQGPGCLSYAVILPINETGPTANITSTNRFVMERQRGLLESLTGYPVRVEGITDLAIDGVKFSGNSQRRRRRFLLFHGTILCRFDLHLAVNVLHHPSREPDYRARRDHAAFLRNIDRDPADVVETLRTGWNAKGGKLELPVKEVEQLATERYASRDWTCKF